MKPLIEAADLTRANRRETEIKNANLRIAKQNKAKLTGVKKDAADLRSAYLTDAETDSPLRLF